MRNKRGAAHNPGVVAKLGSHDLTLFVEGDNGVCFCGSPDRIEEQVSGLGDSSADDEDFGIEDIDAARHSESDIVSGLFEYIDCDLIALESRIADRFRGKAVSFIGVAHEN